MRVGAQHSLGLLPELLPDLRFEVGRCDRLGTAKDEGFIRGMAQQYGRVVELALLVERVRIRRQHVPIGRGPECQTSPVAA